MSGSEKVILSFQEFERNISKTWREFREENYFCDVTLACDDRQVEAHRVILSACSPVFKKLLVQNPHQHPLLYLRGVKFSELVGILDFIYLGEVNIHQEDLKDFVTVAQELGIKGLCENPKSLREKKLKPTDVLNDNGEEPFNLEPITAIKVEDDVYEMNYNNQFDMPSEDDKQITDDVIEDVYDSQEMTIKNGLMFSCPKCTYKTARKGNLKTHIQSVHLGIRNHKVQYFCDKCDYKTPRKSNYTRHITSSIHNQLSTKLDNIIYNQQSINNQNEDEKNYELLEPVTEIEVDSENYHDERIDESAHEGNAVNDVRGNALSDLYKCAVKKTTSLTSMHDKAQLSCDKCDFETTKKFCLTRHIESVHERVRIACDHCDFKTSNRGNMKIHMKTVHGGIKYSCEFCNYKVSEKYNLKKTYPVGT